MSNYNEFKKILDNQALRGVNEYGTVNYVEDSITHTDRHVIKLTNQNILFIFSSAGRLIGIKNLAMAANL